MSFFLQYLSILFVCLIFYLYFCHIKKLLFALKTFIMRRLVIFCIAIITYLCASAQQETQNKMSEYGVTAAMVMQYSTDLDETRVKRLKAKFADQLTSPQNAGKVVPIPQGLTLQPLNMSMADSQFYELRKYSALQIAAAFGIKPNQINDYEKSSYNSSEMQQLDFLVDTLMYRIIQYEQEINSKVITPAETAPS